MFNQVEYLATRKNLTIRSRFPNDTALSRLSFTNTLFGGSMLVTFRIAAKIDITKWKQFSAFLNP
jgi:hypothetical protein